MLLTPCLPGITVCNSLPICNTKYPHSGQMNHTSLQERRCRKNGKEFSSSSTMLDSVTWHGAWHMTQSILYYSLLKINVKWKVLVRLIKLRKKRNDIESFGELLQTILRQSKKEKCRAASPPSNVRGKAISGYPKSSTLFGNSSQYWQEKRRNKYLTTSTLSRGNVHYQYSYDNVMKVISIIQPRKGQMWQTI